MLPDDHYCRWPAFASRISFAYNTASHDSIGAVTPFEVQHGAPSRNALLTPLLDSPEIDDEKELVFPENLLPLWLYPLALLANWQRRTTNLSETKLRLG
jgi:hypothetical protein